MCAQIADGLHGSKKLLFIVHCLSCGFKLGWYKAVQLFKLICFVVTVGTKPQSVIHSNCWTEVYPATDWKDICSTMCLCDSNRMQTCQALASTDITTICNNDQPLFSSCFSRGLAVSFPYSTSWKVGALLEGQSSSYLLVCTSQLLSAVC